ncbi:DUF2293 domain-containing protein [Desulfosediminicola flagellatus]|uniref:DUF2293 domain-containing protein n=1 Tax=Desulfosediminicola flagellatus TaxID=2569541 RepID=UPI0010AB8A89|nr:DUF2293 domain-containing protein [Desulfosediminicola flagellatus]
MPDKNRIVSPGFKIGTVISEKREVLTPPADWAFLAAGDGPLTRNVKKLGVCWQVQVQKGRRTMSKGIWTKEEYILSAKAELEAKRATPEFERKKAADKQRRDRKHSQYVEEFYQQTLRFLNFHTDHRKVAEQLARSVTEHATPVGSGTVARTERIPVEERAQAAVIAWMRHNTTAYDQMHIARIKGRRREVRRMLADRSKELLRRYRQGLPIETECPLYKALV